MGFVRNLQLLIKLLASWRLATLVIGAVLVLLNVADLSRQYGLTAAETGVATFGVVAGFAFLKASWLLMFNRLVFRSRFEGSYFVMAALVSMLFLVALGSAAYLGSSRVSSFPSAAMPWLLGAAYVFLTLVLSLTFKVTNWLMRGNSNGEML